MRKLQQKLEEQLLLPPAAFVPPLPTQPGSLLAVHSSSSHQPSYSWQYLSEHQSRQTDCIRATKHTAQHTTARQPMVHVKVCCCHRDIASTGKNQSKQRDNTPANSVLYNVLLSPALYGTLFEGLLPLCLLQSLLVGAVSLVSDHPCASL